MRMRMRCVYVYVICVLVKILCANQSNMNYFDHDSLQPPRIASEKVLMLPDDIGI